nr:putative ribonuclease H-like domain-containing protein [Tanacetum cinerariifolium]
MKGKAVKSSAYWSWKPSQTQSNKGPKNNSVSVVFKKYTYIDTQGRLKSDSSCSRHMIGNISYLSDYEPFDGGYVSFGQGGCKIIGKGTTKTGKLEFENVFFVKDLKYNMFSVSQICDNKNSVLFTDSECIVLGRDFKLLDDVNILLRTPRQHNMYSIDLNNIVPHRDLTCLVAKASADECNLWHRRLGHLNFKTMNKLVRHNLVRGLPTKCFENDHNCTACLKGKQHKASCKSKLVTSVSKPLHTLHMDLFGPTSVSSISHKLYCLVVTDDFSRFTWTFFLRTKDETSGILRKFITEIENLKDLKVKIIRVLVNKAYNKTPYELFNGRTPAIGFLKSFGCHVMILNTLDNLGYFIGYSMSSKAFRVFNKRTKRVEGNLHVDLLENKLIEKGESPNWLFDIDTLTNSMNYVPVVVIGTTSTNFSGTKDAASQDVEKDVSFLRYIALPNWFHEAHLESSTSNAQDACNADAPESSGNFNPIATSTNPPANHMETLTVESLIPTVSSPVLTACLDDSPEPSSDTRLISKKVTSQDDTPSLDNILTFQASLKISLELQQIQEEPKKISDAFKDPSWVEAMQEELLQFKIQNVWSLVNCPEGEEGIDYEEVFVPVARIKAIKLFLAYASFMGFTVYQMDVKSSFLYGTIDEEVYVMQPPGFQDQEFPTRVYKVEKAMYGLHQAPRAWSTNSPMDKENPWGKDETGKDVDLHLYRSMIGSLMYLVASRPNIMFVVCVCARHQVTPKECHLHAVKRILRYLKGHPKLGTIMATSTTEAEYVAAASGYGQVLWIQNQLLDYGHHFIRDCFEKKLISVDHIHTDDNVADLLTKPFDAGRFQTVPLFDSMLVHQGEGSGTPTEPHHTPSPKAQQSSPTAPSSPPLPPITTATIPTVIPNDIPILRQYSRRARIAQSLAIPTTADEPTSPLEDDSQGEACPTIFGLEAGHDRANIIKTSTLPHDLTPRVTSLAADEGSMQHQLTELMDLCTLLQRQKTKMASKIEAQDLEITSLKARIKLLEDKDGGGVVPSGEDATIKGRSLEIEEDTVVSVPPAVKVATISVPTGSGMVLTASPIFTTASVVTPYARRKGKEKMVELDTPKKKKLQEQIDVQMEREIEEQMAREDQRRNIKITMKKYSSTKLNKPSLSPRSNKENFICHFLKATQDGKKHFKGMSLEEIREKFIPVWKRIEDFVPMASKDKGEKVKRKGLRDVNDAMGSKKKSVVVTSDPLALIADKTNVSKSKEKVVVSSDSEGSEADDFSELKKITPLLAKAFNRRKFYSKPTNNNLRTSSSSQSANKKQEFVKTDTKKVKKKDDEKKRDMSRVKCYNCKKEGQFAKDCKKAKVKDYE